jgi:hypothetical protein
VLGHPIIPGALPSQPEVNTNGKCNTPQAKENKKPKCNDAQITSPLLVQASETEMTGTLRVNPFACMSVLTQLDVCWYRNPECV